MPVIMVVQFFNIPSSKRTMAGGAGGGGGGGGETARGGLATAGVPPAHVRPMKITGRMMLFAPFPTDWSSSTHSSSPTKKISRTSTNVGFWASKLPPRATAVTELTEVSTVTSKLAAASTPRPFALDTTPVALKKRFKAATGGAFRRRTLTESGVLPAKHIIPNIQGRSSDFF